MLGRLILGLIWLTCVHSEALRMMSMGAAAMGSKMPMGMSMASEDSMGVASPISKSKRFLSHQHASPCPPFYPHFHMPPEPMYAVRPYGPPSYPKNDIHIQPTDHHQHHQPPQFIHQPPYTSYVPKQTIQYVKHQSPPPIYHQPAISPPIHQVQPVHPIQPTYIKPPPRWFPFQQQQPMYQHKVSSYPKQPIFSYAPAYHKPMPTIWPISGIKKIDYPPAHVPSYPKVIHKPEAPPKCAPCPEHPPPQPSISYVKIAQPIHQPPPPSHVYLPAPSHQSIVKPCDK